jgi:hypothetical protein
MTAILLQEMNAKHGSESFVGVFAILGYSNYNKMELPIASESYVVHNQMVWLTLASLEASTKSFGSPEMFGFLNAFNLKTCTTSNWIGRSDRNNQIPPFSTLFLGKL